MPLLVSLTGALACGDDGPTGVSGPPIVASVNGATLPSGQVGSTVIIEGQNFGSTRGGGQVLFTDGAGATVPASIASAGDWTDGFIVTTVPSGAVTGDLIVRTVGGESTPVVFTVTQNAPFNPSVVSWTSTSALPAERSGHAAAFAEIRDAATERVVYVIGGADDTNAPQADVHYATVNATGSLSSWTATASLPQAAAFHRVVVATPANSAVTGLGFVLVLGGVIDDAGQPTASVYRGTLTADGAISAWSVVASLPVPLHSFGAAVVFGHVYVWGGATTGNAPVASAYRAEIQASGDLGAWQSLPSMPFGRAYFGSGAFAGHLYAFGGDSSALAPHAATLTGGGRVSNITFAKIDLRSRGLTSAGWQVNPTSLVKTVSKHTSVVAGGNVLVTAGLYNGATTGSTEETFAQLNGDGTAATFNGATGSSTILSAGGGNLFNHATVGYVDGSGAFHILVVGGDDVNSPGTKHTGVFFY